MNKNLVLTKTIDIHVGAAQVWDTLTIPAKNKELFGRKCPAMTIGPASPAWKTGPKTIC